MEKGKRSWEDDQRLFVCLLGINCEQIFELIGSDLIGGCSMGVSVHQPTAKAPQRQPFAISSGCLKRDIPVAWVERHSPPGTQGAEPLER